MKIAIVCGSHRKNSQSSRIGRIIADALSKRGIQNSILDLAGNPLPLWDEEVWDGAEKWKKVWGPYSRELQSSDGFVIVTPEWHGMVPAGLKNFFLLCGGTRDLAHKPGYIVAVSAGTGGSYPVAELRMSSYKNTRICYLPEHLIVRHCESFLIDPANLTESDQKTLDRMEYGLSLLLEYAQRMSPIREMALAGDKKFPNGM